MQLNSLPSIIRSRIPNRAKKALSSLYVRVQSRRKVASLPQSLVDEIEGRTDNIAWYGKELHVLVEAARECPRPRGHGAEYDLIKSEFDFAFYFMQYPNVMANRLDPVSHYMRIGAASGRDPAPWFSSSLYLSRYPAAAFSPLTPFGHWLKTGRKNGRIGSPFVHHNDMSELLDLSPEQAYELLIERTVDIRNRLAFGELGEMVARAADTDPLVQKSWGSSLSVRCLPFSSDFVLARNVSLFKLQKEADFRRAKSIVVTDYRPQDSGWSVAADLIGSLVDLHGADEVVVILTGRPAGNAVPEKVPENVRVLKFANATMDMRPADRDRPLIEILRTLRPEMVINVDSETLWAMFTAYGKVLSDISKVVACFVENPGRNLLRAADLPSAHVYRHFNRLWAVCSPSQAVLDDLTWRYMIPEEDRHRLLLIPEGPGCLEPIRQYGVEQTEAAEERLVDA